jgi:hypothetical protein
VYPFSANIPDQSDQTSSVGSDGIPFALTNTSGNGDSRGAAGDGCRHRYRVHVDAVEDVWRVEGSERPKKESASGLNERRNDMVGIV